MGRELWIICVPFLRTNWDTEVMYSYHCSFPNAQEFCSLEESHYRTSCNNCSNQRFCSTVTSRWEGTSFSVMQQYKSLCKTAMQDRVHMQPLKPSSHTEGSTPVKFLGRPKFSLHWFAVLFQTDCFWLHSQQTEVSKKIHKNTFQ